MLNLRDTYKIRHFSQIDNTRDKRLTLLPFSTPRRDSRTSYRGKYIYIANLDKMNDTMHVEETAESQKLYSDQHVDNILLSSPVPPEVERENETVENQIKFENLIRDEDMKIEDAIIKNEDEIIKDENIKDEEDSTSSADEAQLKETEFLKSLLSASTVSSLPVVEKMITTTEVTDEKLNLKKILYQRDTEKKEDEKELTPNDQPINTNDTQVDDDDRRLVIDISDEEKDGTVERAVNGKSMPTLNAASEDVRKFSTERSHPMRLSRQFQRSQHSKYRILW